MRIRYLALTNYRRHRDTRLEPGDGVIALLGRNGAGKSTLLEAVGFALFGVPATRTGKELLRFDGAAPGDPVEVSLAFDLGGNAIEVVRTLRGKNLTPSATLTVDGQLLVQPGGGSNEAVTQEMERRLGMGRDAFFTTIVARQKELARLGDQSPADRKRLLLSMLGVDRIDHAIQAARENRRGAEGRMKAIQDVLADEAALRQQQAEARQQVAAAKEEEAQAQAAWVAAKERLAVAVTALQESQRDHEARLVAERSLERTTAEAEAAAQQHDGLREQVEAAQDASTRMAEVAPAAARLPRLRQDLEAAQGAARAAAERQQRLALVATEKKALQRLRATRQALPSSPEPNGGLAQAQKELATIEEKAGAGRERAAVLRAEVQATENRLRRIGNLGDAAACPTCDRPLEDHLPHLHNILQEERAAKRSRLEAVQEAAAAHEAALAEARARLASVQELAQRHQLAQAEAKHLDARIEETVVRIQGLEAAIPAPPIEHGDLVVVAAAVEKAEKAATEHARCEALAMRLPELQTRLQAAAALLTQREAARQKAAQALAVTPDTAKALAAASKAHGDRQGQERQNERRLLDVQARLRLAAQHLQEAEARLAERQRQQGLLESARLEARYWAALAGAQRDGLLDRFKDHIVGRIGPAVSAEASRLLSRFTGGRYTEVLLDGDYQLYVADGGVHYTLSRFSGGESDLVHLALRLAVSRLLVERAGGSDLRFLALDEVFGSLDQERRGHVLAALRGLRSLYSQVLLVTHQEGLQEALDQAIIVEEQDGEAVVRIQNG